jgi:hypothetical protein
MSGGDVVAEKRREMGKYIRWVGIAILGLLIIFLVWKYTRPLSVDSIWIEYPIRQDPTKPSILLVKRHGDTLLSQSGPRQVVRGGTFKIDKLLQELMGQLVNTWDEDKRVDQPVGVVRIWFSNETSGTYLVYDDKYFSELFGWARANLVDAP